jgi:RNA polymerase sigma factor (sigma-70 family)
MASREQDERLARDWHAWAFRFAFFLTGDRDRAADLSQDALVRALVRRPHDLAEEAFGSWLRTVMVRLHIDHKRRVVRELAAFKRWLPVFEREAAESEPLESSELLQALAALSARQRACVVLRYLGDLSETDVAETLGLRLGTVKAHLARAREALRLRLGEATEPVEIA